MAIVPLRHVTFVGRLADKDRVLQAMQAMGCVHLVPTAPARDDEPGGPSPEARRALRFLQQAPRQRRQVTDPADFDAVAVRDHALAVERRLLDLGDERDFLLHRIDSLAVWGDFALPPLDELGGQRLWFYVVPKHLLHKFAQTELVWSVVRRDARFAYVVVVSATEPTEAPVARTHTGERSLASLEQRLEQVEVAMEDGEAERAGLTRWRDQFADAIEHLEDVAARIRAGHGAVDLDPLFGLAGFVPSTRVADLKAYAVREGVCLRVREVAMDDDPPTLLENPPVLRGGEGLVTFYMTPGYDTWDPSGTVLFSFALFFAMILADAGYALVLGLAWVMGWRGWRHRPLARRLGSVAGITVAFALGYGVLAGSYFGLEPAPGTPLATLRVLNVRDSSTLMPLSIVLGGLHLWFANVAEAWRLAPSRVAIAPIGWAIGLVGAFGWAWSATIGVHSQRVQLGGQVALAVGLVAVLLFSSPERAHGQRLLGGMVALTRVSGLFGDVLSYLRLFALGLASCSLAVAFNELAVGIRANLGPPGVVVALLVLLVGHGLNLALAVIGGVVHGLRLNVIEFFNWSLRQEGRPFVAFSRKERMRCNP